MITLSRYVRASLKRALKLLPALVILTAVLVGVMGVAFTVMSRSNEEMKIRVRVGMVGDTEGEHLGIGLLVLDKLDTSAVAIEFVPYDDVHKAGEDVRSGYLAAYVDVPEGFLESVLSGANDPMTLITADRTDTLIPALIREMADYASGYVTDSQKAIRAMRQCVREYDIDEVDMDEVTDDLNLRYITMVTGRGRLVEMTETGEMGNASHGGYYLCSFIFVFLLLFSVMATPLFAGSREKRAYYGSYGVKSVEQISAEYVAYAAVALLIVFSLCLAAGLLLPEGVVKEFGDPLRGMMDFFLQGLPSMLLVFSISFLLWELVPDTVNGVLLQFIMAAGIGYISGCFYPSKFFPVAVQEFAVVLPTGIALGGMREALKGSVSLGTVALTLALAAGFFLASCAVRSYRLRQGGKA
ncbi:MAG: ABC transporter permease [Clostridia bacterium]|nr:ABC transporter permease [Clostridia bacterium]